MTDKNTFKEKSTQQLQQEMRRSKRLFYTFSIGFCLIIVFAVVLFFTDTVSDLNRFPYLLFVPIPIFIFNQRNIYLGTKKELENRRL
jgi:hypothetical protein